MEEFFRAALLEEPRRRQMSSPLEWKLGENGTLPETNILHLPGCAIPKGKDHLLKHQFSGAKMFVSGRVV